MKEKIMKKLFFYFLLCYLITSNSIQILSSMGKNNLKSGKKALLKNMQETLKERKKLLETDKNDFTEDKKVLIEAKKIILKLNNQLENPKNTTNLKLKKRIASAILYVLLAISISYGTNFAINLLEQTKIILIDNVFKSMILNYSISALLSYPLTFIISKVPLITKFVESLPKSLLKKITNKKHTFFDEIIRSWEISRTISHMAK